MPSIQETLYAALAADTGVTNLVGDRIFPGEIPDDEAVAPWLYYAVPSTDPIDAVDDAEQSALSQVEFHALADTYAGAKAILDAVYAALNGYYGGQVSRALWGGDTEETTEDGYHHACRYQVLWSKAAIVATPGSSARITTGLTSITLTACSHTLTLDCSGLTLDGAPLTPTLIDGGSP